MTSERTTGKTVLRVIAVVLFAGGLIFGMSNLLESLSNVQLSIFIIFVFINLVASLAGRLSVPAVHMSTVILLAVGGSLSSPWWIAYAFAQFVLFMLDT